MKKLYTKQVTLLVTGLLIATSIPFLFTFPATAGSYDGQDLAYAILENQTTLVSSSYYDTDHLGHRQGIVLSSQGIMHPTEGSTFIILSTGIAGANPVTEDQYNPGSERGGWFAAGKYIDYGESADEAKLTLHLEVPPYMHYLYYDVQFFSSEYPEYVGSPYNDKFTGKVESPSQGTTQYMIDVNSGDFILNAKHLAGTGFDIFATSGDPGGVDWVSTTPQTPGADAGATALVRREHPVSPYETIVVTFDIKDTGDNQFDSAVFIDNLMFAGFARTDIIARKTVEDLNGGLVECGDILEYTITISNIGTAGQSNNPGNEFEDYIPDNATFEPGSLSATFGTINYESETNKITWNGAIAAESSIALSFAVTINEGLFNGALISNQGTVYWDSNEDGTNDAMELTDDPAVDDGIDQDLDGETDDDDPTILMVTSYEAPTEVTEDFSDDFAGGLAQQSYDSHLWFETSQVSGKSNFEVAPSYYYSTAKSFKIKLRESESPQYWNYSLSSLDSDLKAWELWFACGNVSEPADLLVDFKNSDGDNITKLKFEYVEAGYAIPTEYVLVLYYWNPGSGWVQLASDYTDGYLFNNWYKLRIEKDGATNINYSLYRSGHGLIRFAVGNQLSAPFSDFTQVEWRCTKEPVVCPMFFFDEHRLELYST